jgi:hemoglobin-like flavoprotein
MYQRDPPTCGVGPMGPLRDLSMSTIQSETDAVAEQWLTLATHMLRLSHSEGHAIARSFYQELFARQPGLRAHFAGLDVDQQAAKLWAVLRLVVAKQALPESMDEATARVAHRHDQRNVSYADFDVFVETLADILAHSQRAVPPAEAKRRWLPELRDLTTLIRAKSP